MAYFASHSIGVPTSDTDFMCDQTMPMARRHMNSHCTRHKIRSFQIRSGSRGT